MLANYIKTHGTSYYLASLFFPKKIKQDTFTLYAFVRVPDDIVDAPDLSDDEKKIQLQDFCDTFWDVYTHGSNKSCHPVSEVIVSAVELFHRHEMPRDRIQSFFDAMGSDLEVKNYISYKQLQGYMYGSAEVVGLMMCKIIGYDHTQEREVFYTARCLGEAMQYTNFLRDIKEDYDDLGRIYMPEKVLHVYGLSHEILKQYIDGKAFDESRKVFMGDQILHCRKLYAKANKGIQYLNPSGRIAVKYASWLYEGILDNIYANNFDVFFASAHTTKRNKFCILFRRSCGC